MERIRGALEGLGQPFVKVWVASTPSSGFGRDVSIVVTTAEETVTTEQVRRLLQTIYDSTPEGYPEQLSFGMRTEARVNFEGRQGDDVNLNPMLEELGLIPPGRVPSLYNFLRKDLEPILDQ